jgi:hypothetical protein
MRTDFEIVAEFESEMSLNGPAGISHIPTVSAPAPTYELALAIGEAFKAKYPEALSIRIVSPAGACVSIFESEES